MNESETRAELIDPVLVAAGWGVVAGSRIRREYNITPGRLEGAGRRGKPLIADFVLEYRNTKLSVVEAKARDAELTEGVAQAKNYAGKLAVRFTYATNGRGVYAIDMATGKEGPKPMAFPTPDELWAMTHAKDRCLARPFRGHPVRGQGRFASEPILSGHRRRAVPCRPSPRGSQRILLTLATGTGKTFIAFQIAWKIFKSRWNLSRDPSVASRASCSSPTATSSPTKPTTRSPPFPEDALVRIAPDEIKKKGKVPTNGSMFLHHLPDLHVRADQGRPAVAPFRRVSARFLRFHRHRRVPPRRRQRRGQLARHPQLFRPAVQLGLTATPKRRQRRHLRLFRRPGVTSTRSRKASTTASSRRSRCKQISTTLDDYIYTPDDTVVEGEIEEGKLYEEMPISTAIIEIKEREKKRVEIFMEQINQREKTLVFCATQAHALAVRDLINQIKTSKDPNYCQRVTANDGALGEQHLRDFQDNEKTIPTILTTSQKLSTGVDARNIRNIVLMRPVNSMIEFKQIIGRGTRLFDGKDYFTIYDFVKAHHHFSDPEWDGEPIEPDPKPTPPPGPKPGPPEGPGPGPEPPPPRQRIKVKLADGKARTIQHMMMTSFWHPDGTPMSAQQFMELLFGKLPEFFKSEDELRALWSAPTRGPSSCKAWPKRASAGTNWPKCKRSSTPRKATCSTCWPTSPTPCPRSRGKPAPPKPRWRSAPISTPSQQVFLDFVLSHYVTQGVEELAQEKLTPLLRLKYHDSLADAVADLGTPPEIAQSFASFQKYLYEDVA
jgi:type I restriction enzyme R subunit